MSLFSSSSGRADHAGAAADTRTDRHVAPGAAAEHPHPQRADSEDRRRSALTTRLKKGFRFYFIFLTSPVSIAAGNSNFEAHGATLYF